MDRLKNPALWCALLYAIAASVAQIWDFQMASTGYRITQLIQHVTAEAGSLIFGAALARPPAGKLPS